MFWQEITPKSGTPQSEIERVANNLGIHALPRPQMYLAMVTHILAEEMGFRSSAEAGRSHWGNGYPIPTMSYSLVEYLMGLDLSQMSVLEIGAGDSTAFWASRTKSVISLETNQQWVETLKPRLPTVQIETVEGDAMPARMTAFPQQFDIIVIDPAANRARCARAALPKLAKGGFIIIDNSDWYPNACRIVRDAGFNQVDFHDFRPQHYFRATSSIFFTPEFRAKPRESRLPLPPMAGKVLANDPWDQE